jgi:hypothetical protein
MAICGLVSIELPASATAVDITGTWEITIHYQPDDSDYMATYILSQYELLTADLDCGLPSANCGLQLAPSGTRCPALRLTAPRVILSRRHFGTMSYSSPTVPVFS